MLQSFDNAARAINLDWGTRYDGKQMQRISEALGRTLVILLAGGDKRTQDRDIKTALRPARNL